MCVSYKRYVAKKCIREESSQHVPCCLLVVFERLIGALQAAFMYYVFVLACNYYLFGW